LATGNESAPRRTACWLGLVAFLAYLPFFHGHFAGTDEMGAFLTTRALYETGSFAVREGPHRFRGRDGRTYAHFAPALPVLALPLYALGDLAGHALPADWLAHLAPRAPEEGRIDTLVTPPLFAVALYAPLASALLVAVFFRLGRRLGASARSAALAAALLGATSYAAAQSVYFLRHTSEAITLLASFEALLAFRASGCPRTLALASGLGSLTLLVAVPALVGLAPLALYGLFLLAPRLRAAGRADRVRLLAAAALPAAAVVAAHVALNLHLWGRPFDSPMLAQRARFSTPLLEGLAGFLVSPGASVFAYSPLLLLLPWLLPVFWRERRAECAAAVGIALAFLLFCARFELWPGLWSAPGPRYLFVAPPALLLPLGLWLDRGPSRAARAVLLCLAGAGLFVQLPLVLARWSEVIQGMGYKQAVARSGFAFLFEPSESPILGSWLALRAGHVDAWLFDLARGSAGVPAAPLGAALLVALWAVCLGFAVRGLRRSLR
jgi:hypothetical protein